MDENCAKILAEEGFITRLVDLLKAKQEDDELVCQVTNIEAAYRTNEIVFRLCTSFIKWFSIL